MLHDLLYKQFSKKYRLGNKNAFAVVIKRRKQKMDLIMKAFVLGTLTTTSTVGASYLAVGMMSGVSFNTPVYAEEQDVSLLVKDFIQVQDQVDMLVTELGGLTYLSEQDAAAYKKNLQHNTDMMEKHSQYGTKLTFFYNEQEKIVNELIIRMSEDQFGKEYIQELDAIIQKYDTHIKKRNDTVLYVLEKKAVTSK